MPRRIRGRTARRPTLRLEFSQGIQDAASHEPQYAWFTQGFALRPVWYPR